MTFQTKWCQASTSSVPSWALVSCTKFIQWTSRAVGGLLPLKTFLSVSARINLVVSYSRGPRTRSCPFGWWRHWTHETEEVRSRNSLLRTHKTTETKKKKIWLARLSVCGPCIPGDGSGDFSQPNHGNLLSENDPVVKIQSFLFWKTVFLHPTHLAIKL